MIRTDRDNDVQGGGELIDDATVNSSIVVDTIKVDTLASADRNEY